MTQLLADKIALVTGASRGIGRATAKQLADRGAEVFVHYARSRDEADSAVDEITAAGGTARALQADVASVEGIDRLTGEVISALDGRKLDILVNNAGVAEFVATLDTTAESIDRQLAVNVRAPLLLTTGLVPHLSEGASIVFLSSVVARTYFADITAYALTKGAVDTMVRQLAVELGAQNIRVNAVAPGAIATDMSAWLDTDDGKATAHAIQALKRVGQPEDIARVIAFLAGPDSGWITGQVIDVSGGTKL